MEGHRRKRPGSTDEMVDIVITMPTISLSLLARWGVVRLACVTAWRLGSRRGSRVLYQATTSRSSTAVIRPATRRWRTCPSGSSEGGRPAALRRAGRPGRSPTSSDWSAPPPRRPLLLRPPPGGGPADHRRPDRRTAGRAAWSSGSCPSRRSARTPRVTRSRKRSSSRTRRRPSPSVATTRRGSALRHGGAARTRPLDAPLLSMERGGPRWPADVAGTAIEPGHRGEHVGDDGLEARLPKGGGQQTLVPDGQADLPLRLLGALRAGRYVPADDQPLLPVALDVQAAGGRFGECTGHHGALAHAGDAGNQPDRWIATVVGIARGPLTRSSSTTSTRRRSRAGCRWPPAVRPGRWRGRSAPLRRGPGSREGHGASPRPLPRRPSR